MNMETNPPFTKGGTESSFEITNPSQILQQASDGLVNKTNVDIDTSDNEKQKSKAFNLQKPNDYSGLRVHILKKLIGWVKTESGCNWIA